VPSRKQRRRRAKERRHDYEFVYVDEEGHEVEVDSDEAEQPKRTQRKAQAASGGRRPIEPPSWRRVAKRGLLFAPLMFITFSLLGKNESFAIHVSRTVFLLVLFLPFSYVMDSMIYRSYRRRLEKPKKT